MGNLNSKRDWGHAKDYIEAMWLMLQQDSAEDYVIATGVTTPVRDFIRMAFGVAGIELEFRGEGVDETAVVTHCHDEYKLPIGKEVVGIDKRYFRPTEVDLLIGDATKARTKLGWKPKYTVQTLAEEMVESDLEIFKREKLLAENGFYTRKQFE